MSHVLSPRLAFAGRFVSDVSTINNYNEVNGQWVDSWNAAGTAAFDFVNCSVTGAWASGADDDADGVEATGDPCLSYVVESNPEDSSAKMVDLDPS
jgi:hypothetical protein